MRPAPPASSSASPSANPIASPTATPAAAASRSRIWLHTLRPQTLALSVTPVLAGCLLAWMAGNAPRWLLAALTVLAAVLIQAGTNLLNDVGDGERGADGPDRLGPPRATALGLLPAHAVRRAGFAALGAALALGLVLAWAGGWPIMLLGLLSLLCGWAYTAGPRPIAYGPFGEWFVWVFFGLAAVVGAYWLQAPHPALPVRPWLVGHALGALAAAVMLVNNTRDAASDARVGKRTLATRLGRRRCNTLYAVLLLQPFVCMPWLNLGHAGQALMWCGLPFSLSLWRLFARTPEAALNPFLGHTARLQMLWAALMLTACWLAQP